MQELRIISMVYFWKEEENKRVFKKFDSIYYKFKKVTAVS